MLEVLEYFSINSDRELFVFVCCSLGLTFLIVLIFSYSDWLIGKVVSLFSLSRPVSHSVIGERYSLGNRQLYRIRWQVRGAEELIIPKLGLAINLNPFRNNNRKAFVGNSELFLEIEDDVNQLQLDFRNLWGKYSVNLMVNATTKKNNSLGPKTDLRRVLQKAYLGQAQDILLQRFSKAFHGRKQILNNWTDKFEKNSSDINNTLHEKLSVIKTENHIIKNLSINEQTGRFKQLYSQLKNSNQIHLFREELQRIRQTVH
jgi:hypothetical protein